MTRISFIMPTFNRGRYIAESLQAILAQMSDDDELLVLDDGSTDGTTEIVRGFGDSLRYEAQENAGKSVALNRALKKTDGRYIWICDDDDILLPGAVTALVSRIEASGDDFVFGRYTRFREIDGARVDLGPGYWPDLSHGSMRRHILEDAFVMQNAALVRRSAYERVGPFDEAMLRSLDYEMFARLALDGSASYVDQLVFEQRKHDGARGPSHQLHAEARSDAVWLDYDSRIFTRIFDQVPLATYEGLFEGDAASTISRARCSPRSRRG
jgi:glycosyltransferase involved in cell wall biosynthesis